MTPDNLHNPLRADMTLGELLRSLPDLANFLDQLSNSLRNTQRIEFDGQSGLKEVGVSGSRLVTLDPQVFPIGGALETAYTNTQDSMYYPNYSATATATLTVDGSDGLTMQGSAGSYTLGLTAASTTVPGAMTTTAQDFAGIKTFTDSTTLENGGTPGSAHLELVGSGNITSNNFFEVLSDAHGAVLLQCPGNAGATAGLPTVGNLQFGNFSGSATTNVSLIAASTLYLSGGTGAIVAYASGGFIPNSSEYGCQVSVKSIEIDFYTSNNSLSWTTPQFVFDAAGNMTALGNVNSSGGVFECQGSVGTSGTDTIGNVIVGGIIKTIGSGPGTGFGGGISTTVNFPKSSGHMIFVNGILTAVV